MASRLYRWRTVPSAFGRLGTGELLHTFSFPGEGILQARFAPDGHRLITAHLVFTNLTDGIRLWDLTTKQKIRSFGGDGVVQRCEFVGNRLITAKRPQEVELWDIETGELVRALPGTNTVRNSNSGISDRTQQLPGSGRLPQRAGDYLGHFHRPGSA
jgi:WD40 repeat protein